MRTNTITAAIVSAACVLIVAAGIVAFWWIGKLAGDIARMSADLGGVSTSLQQVSTQLQELHRVDARLSQMNGKLSQTNRLLGQTNANLTIMVAESKTATSRLDQMDGDIAIMSRKISGSFLFRGVH